MNGAEGEEDGIIGPLAGFSAEHIPFSGGVANDRYDVLDDYDDSAEDGAKDDESDSDYNDARRRKASSRKPERASSATVSRTPSLNSARYPISVLNEPSTSFTNMGMLSQNYTHPASTIHVADGLPRGTLQGAHAVLSPPMAPVTTSQSYRTEINRFNGGSTSVNLPPASELPSSERVQTQGTDSMGSEGTWGWHLGDPMLPPEEFFKRCMALLDFESVVIYPKLENIIVMTQISAHSATRPNGTNSGYRLLTIAMTLAKDLKLNYEPEESMGLSWVEKEQRRRIFWHLYMMDRYLAALENRDLMISDREVHLNLPCLDAVYEVGHREGFSEVQFDYVHAKYVVQADDPMMAPPTTCSARQAFETLDEPAQLKALIMSGSIGPSALQIMIFHMFGAVIRFHHFFQRPSADRSRYESEKARLDRQLDSFYEDLPPNIRALDNVDHSNTLRSTGAKPDRRISTGLMLWHTIKILLHGPWDVNSMCSDTVWLGSSDFLVCAEHSELIVRKVENYLLRGSGGQIEQEVLHKISVYAKAFHALRSRWRLARYMQLVVERELVQSGLDGLDLTVESVASEAVPKVDEMRWEVGGMGVMVLAE
ncbi:hypothetical protein HDU93_002071, partial [Gonapodya sp. JEL0774]